MIATNLDPARSAELRHGLIAARAMIADQSRWCQRELVTADGRVCARGAIRFSQPPEADLFDLNMALIRTSIEIFGQDITHVNDSSSPDPAVCHANVMKVYDLAIERAPEEA